MTARTKGIRNTRRGLAITASGVAIFTLLAACATPPEEPDASNDVWLDQGWTDSERRWFHFASQGTKTFEIPYEWFVVLERPESTEHWYADLEGRGGRFADASYLARFGFIPGEISGNNPDGLPIGFARTEALTDPTTGRTFNAVGLTCAACHTGQMVYAGTRVLVDGAPAVSNLDTFSEALGLAVIETRVIPGKYSRFERALLGADATDAAKAQLKAAFDAAADGFIQQAKAALDGKGSVDAGFTRLDALNSIGNAVFGLPDGTNVAPKSAPVNYPHIWNTSWFDWVQYDASIMQPMVRNAGEGMGVGAPSQLAPGPHQFASSVDIATLHRIETQLAGTEHPQAQQAFGGLQSPRWPADVFGAVDERLAAEGKSLYKQRCEACHRPPVSDPAFWSDRYWYPITEGGANYLKMAVIPQKSIGTDGAQAAVLANRTVDTTSIQLEGEVCTPVDGKLTTAKVEVGSNVSFALALGLAVQDVVDHYYDANDVAPAERAVMNGNRPNCLQAGAGYKARPLNGIWATAPFLHNGSVPTLYELLSPVRERSAELYLGYQAFDPVNVGYVTTGAEIGDTRGLTRIAVNGPDATPGNLNSGHEFSDERGPGVIGKGLAPSQRRALVEYLKTL